MRRSFRGLEVKSREESTDFAYVSFKAGEEDGRQRVKIVYLLTIAGRASRQVYRLVKQIYSPHHYILVHVDR